MGIAANAGSAAVIAAMALTSAQADRTTVGGWVQAGGLSGTGLGGGLGLWLASHAGGPASAALVLAAINLACASPLFWLRTPGREASQLKEKVAGLASGTWRFARSRTGVLAVVAVTMPAALNASGNLFASVAADWKAPADLVAAVTGVMAGVLTLPGCVAAGYLCKRFPSRSVYVAGAALCALGQLGMALGPHTPAAFAAFILINAVVQGLAWGAVTAVTYEHLSPAAAATLGTVLGSLCNLPVVVMLMVVGRVQTAHGSTAMLLTEAGVAAVSLAAYSLLAWLWKPARDETAPAFATSAACV
jgi:Na+/melibiose symporter-like transporter